MTADTMGLEPLPPDYAETREALHRLACYVLSPALPSARPAPRRRNDSAASP